MSLLNFRSYSSMGHTFIYLKARVFVICSWFRIFLGLSKNWRLDLGMVEGFGLMGCNAARNNSIPVLDCDFTCIDV